MADEMSPEAQRWLTEAANNAPWQNPPYRTKEETAQAFRELYERQQAALPWGFRDPLPKAREDVPQFIDKLRDVLTYDADTGDLRYRYGGHLATYRPKGVKHGQVKVWTFTFSSAQVVWLIHKGQWPAGNLKRRDDDVRNDRIENLYCPKEEIRATGGEPAKTRKRIVQWEGDARPARSPGVAKYGANQWQAYVRVAGRQINLGRFKTEAEAIAARAAYDVGDLV